ncbi:MAG TPA: YkvA family protein [Chloroflexia bacterium]|nr:YkvA family protein [Chloroflexia bacterium]
MSDTITQLMENGRLAFRLFNDPRVPSWVRYGVPLLAVLYLVMPLDVLPDFIPVLGQLDDLGVIVLAMSLMAKLAPSYVVDEHRRALGYDPKGGGSESTQGSGGYWNRPPRTVSGQPTARVAREERSIDGEYKVVGDRESSES